MRSGFRLRPIARRDPSFSVSGRRGPISEKQTCAVGGFTEKRRCRRLRFRPMAGRPDDHSFSDPDRPASEKKIGLVSKAKLRARPIEKQSRFVFGRRCFIKFLAAAAELRE